VTPTFIEFIRSVKNNSRPWTGVYILKQGSRYYRTQLAANKVQKTSISLTCQKRKSNPKYFKYGTGCKFRVTFKLVNVFDPAIEGFFDQTNFVVKLENQSVPHNCGGYANIEDARVVKKAIRLIADRIFD